MRLALCLVCLGMAQSIFAQNAGTGSDFNFGLFSNGGSNTGGGPVGAVPTSQTPGLGSGNPNPLGANNGGLQQSTGLTATGLNPGMQNNGLNPGMMNGQTGLNQNQMMGGQTGMMNPTGMAMPGQNGLVQNGMMQNGMSQNGMMQNGMPQNGMMQNGMMGNNMMQNGMMGNNMMQNGMMQNTGLRQNNGMMQNGMMQNGMMQNGMVNAGGMNFQDPTRMSSFNGNNLNQLGFDPNSQANLFQNQLNSQNMPQFGNTQSQFGQGQFGQMSPFGQRMPFPTPFGAQFGSMFTSQPGFGMFPDPMMNAFAPNPFQMSASPMMAVGPMGSVFMPGMEMSNLLFDANGNVVGTTGGLMQTTGLTQTGSGLTQSTGNTLVFPQPTQTMLPVANGIAMPGGFGSTTITANPAILGMGQLVQTQGLTQGGLTPQTAGQLQGMQPNGFGNSMQGGSPQQVGNALLTTNTLPGQGMSSNMQSLNSNSNAFSTNSNAQRANSFALTNNGIPVNSNIEPFSGIVPNQGGTVLKVNTQANNAVLPQTGNPNAGNRISAITNTVNTNSVITNTVSLKSAKPANNNAANSNAFTRNSVISNSNLLTG